jgi:hypothetical protein
MKRSLVSGELSFTRRQPFSAGETQRERERERAQQSLIDDTFCFGRIFYKQPSLAGVHYPVKSAIGINAGIISIYVACAQWEKMLKLR